LWRANPSQRDELTSLILRWHIVPIILGSLPHKGLLVTNLYFEYPVHTDVRFGSLADILRCESHVRFSPESGHCVSIRGVNVLIKKMGPGND